MHISIRLSQVGLGKLFSKIYLLFYSFIHKFSAHSSFKPAHYSSIILKQHNAASQKLVAMTCAFTFNPKTTLFLCIHAVCKALQSSSCPFKVGISGYGNLQTMSTDKWTTSKSTQLQQKFGSNCSLQDFVNAVFPTLTKQTILLTYYSNSDAHYSHIILKLFTSLFTLLI